MARYSSPLDLEREYIILDSPSSIGSDDTLPLPEPYQPSSPSPINPSRLAQLAHKGPTPPLARKTPADSADRALGVKRKLFEESSEKDELINEVAFDVARLRKKKAKLERRIAKKEILLSFLNKL